MELHILLVAVAVSTGLHRMLEPSNLMAKLERLDGAIETGIITAPEMKGIDTRLKSYSVGMLFMLLPGIIAYFVANAIDPGIDGAVQFSIALTIITEVVLMIRLDTWHVAIEKITQRVGK